MPHQRFQEGQVAADAGYVAARQGIAQARKGTRAVEVMHDQLGDHRVVVDADRVAGFDPGVDAHLVAASRQFQRTQGAGGGQEAGVRILGVQPHLDRMAVPRYLLLGQWQRLAGGHAQLPFHQVQAGDHLGDRVFDLQAGVDLHEIELSVGIDDELHRAGVDVADGGGGGHRRLAHGLAQIVVDEGRGRFLQHLLVAALGRAFALVEVDHPAVAVAEHLDLDVPRGGHVALQQHAVAAEGVAGLALAAFQRRHEILQPVHHAHALATAAVGGLDHQREAGARGLARERGQALVLAVVAGHHRHPGLGHQLLGPGLAAHAPH